MRLRAYLSKRMSYVNNALSSIDPSIAKYLKIGVTEGVTYDILRIKGCPCCRDLYYEAYEMYYPSNEELIEACIENSYPDVDYDEMRIVSTPEEDDGYLTYAIIKGEHVVGFETIAYEYGTQIYFN